MAQRENKILLHACCAICSGYPITLLKEKGFTPIVYFCNPNLDSKEEFNKRLDAQKTVCDKYEVELVVEEYEPDSFLEYVKGYEQEPEKGLRCDKCIELRILKTAQKAKELGIDTFATSLIISPHKNVEKIFAISNKIADEYKIKFLETNFRKNDGFFKTNQISKELNLYRQKYCGCKFAKKVYTSSL